MAGSFCSGDEVGQPLFLLAGFIEIFWRQPRLIRLPNLRPIFIDNGVPARVAVASAVDAVPPEQTLVDETETFRSPARWCVQ